MGKFTFGGKSVVTPAVLVRTIVGASRALELFPFGTLCFVGPSDGGAGNGAVYRFPDLDTAKRLLRSGKLLDAITRAAMVGGAAGFIAVVTGAKVAATAPVTGATASGTFTAGDQGTWTNNVTYQIKAGTNGGTIQAVFTWPDALSGLTVTYGGAGTAFDNLSTLSGLQAAMVADPVITPPAAVGLPPILSLAITTDGLPTAGAQTNLSGGTGSGSVIPAYADFKAALDQLDDVSFDMGHLVAGYDGPSQAYADGKAQSHEVYGYLKRWIHQVQVTGASATNSKAINSTAVVNAGIGAASALNSKRSSVCPQQLALTDPNTGLTTLVDAAPLAMGLAAYLGANDSWGPASPLTRVHLPLVADVDYPVLKTNGDQDRAVAGGVWLFERVGLPAPGNVRCVQSVTTAPNDPSTGLPWLLAEFSCMRAADAILANVKAQIETQKPRALGGGNDLQQLAALEADVVRVLEKAVERRWAVSYDRSSIAISTTGTQGMDDLVDYACVPTPPLNHVGVTQRLLPFQAKINLGGVVSG